MDSVVVDNNVMRIEFSSPGVKGRKIFGEGEEFLVPFGEMWRTGANEATQFSTEKDILMDTFDLPKGRYAVLTIPRDDMWEVVINKDWSQWGTHAYDDSLDAARFFVVPQELDSLQERMQFILEKDQLIFRWENTGWSVSLNSTE